MSTVNVPEGGYEILQFFECDHLPDDLRAVAQQFQGLAWTIARDMGLPRCAETSTALRKLLEAKDAAVRAMVQGRGAHQAMTEHMSQAANPTGEGKS